MATQIGDIEAIFRMRDEMTPALESLSGSIDETVEYLGKFTDEQQRAAMAMSAMQDQAVEMDRAMRAAADAVGKWTEADQKAAMSMASVHDEALKMNQAFDQAKVPVDALGEGFKNLSIGGVSVSSVMSSLATPTALAAAGLGALVAGAVAVVGAFAAASKRLIEHASALSDMSAKTGVGVEAIQRLTYAGSLVGVSMDSISTAVTQMNRSLIESPEKFRALGLSAESLKNMDADDALAAIAEAIQGIKNPAEQTAAAMSLLGRSGAGVLPLLKSDLAGAADEAERLGVVLSEQTVKAADDLDDALTKLSTVFEAFLTQTAAAVVTSETATDAIDLLTLSIGALAKKSADGRGERQSLLDDLLRMTQLGGAIQIARALMEGSGPTAKGPKFEGDPEQINFGKILAAGLEEADRVLKEVTKETERLKTEQAAAAKEAEKLAKALSKDIAGAPVLMRELWQQIPNAIKPAEVAVLDFNGTVLKTRVEMEGLVQGFVESAGGMDQLARDAERAGVSLDKALKAETPKEFAAAVKEINAQIQQAINLSNKKVWDMVEEAENGLKASADEAGNLGDALFEVVGLLELFGVEAGSATAELIAGLAGAAEGAATLMAGLASGNPAGIISGITGIAGAVKGLITSDSGLNRILGGALVGGPIGAIGALLFGGGGPTAAERLAHDIRMLQTEFINSMGGLNALSDRAADAGVSLEAMWNARTVAEYEAAVSQVQRAIELTETATNRTKEAMERWGLTAADMGPAFAQNMLHESLAEIYADLQLLEAGGADVAALLAGPMGDSIQGFVQQAQASGAALPEFMRPFIEQLIASGDLIGANGEAITDVSQLNFTQDLSAQVRDLVEEIRDLVNAMRGIPPEIETLVKVNYQTNGAPPTGIPTPPIPPQEPPQGAAEGFYHPALPRDAFFQLHKGERVEVTPANETPARNAMDRGGLGGVINLTMPVSLDAGGPIIAVIQRQIDTGHLRTERA